MIGLLNRDRIRKIIREVPNIALRPLPAPIRRPIDTALEPLTNFYADKFSQVPCAIADLVFLPPVSTCAESAPDRDSAIDASRWKCPVLYRYEFNVAETGWGFGANFMGPLEVVWTSRGPTRWAVNINGSGANAFNVPFEIRFTRVDGLPDNCGSNSSNAPSGVTQAGINDIRNAIREAVSGIPGAGGTDPCACFAPDAEFWQNFKKALESLLAGGSGVPGDFDGDGIPDEQDPGDEEEENENDNSCENKNLLAKLYLMVKNLYQFLGGTEFGNSRCNPFDTDFELNPENLIRDYVEQAYDVQASNNRVISITSRNTTVRSLPQLLAALLAVGYTRSGQWRFPNEVKESLITGGGLPTGNVNLVDEQAYNTWQFDNLLGSIGQFEREIRIQDTDPEEPGNQERTIYLRNTAEALADMFVLMFENNYQTAAILNASIRTGLEIESIKANTFKVESQVDAIIDYLGFKIKDTRKQMPALFTVLGRDGENPSEQNIKDRNSIPKFLEQSQIDVVIQEIDQKENLQFDLNQFRKSSGIIQATLANRIRNVGDIGATLFNQTLELARQLGIVDVDNPETETRDDDFGKKLEELETDFIATPGRTETTNPFGKPMNERPRITEIGQTTEDS